MCTTAKLQPLVALKAARKHLGLSQRQLSYRVQGLSCADLCRMETGRLVPTESQLTRLARALQVDNPLELLEVEEGAA